MATELVDVRHPDVGFSRVPKGTLHIYERSGWEPATADEAAAFAKELDELDKAFTEAGVTSAAERRNARPALEEQAAKAAPADTSDADAADAEPAEKTTSSRRGRGASATQEG